MGCFGRLLPAPRYKTEVPADGAGRLAVPSLKCIIAVNSKNTIDKVIKCLLLCESMFIERQLLQLGFSRCRSPDAIDGDKFNIASTLFKSTHRLLLLQFNDEPARQARRIA